jgi:hypothetical protein
MLSNLPLSEAILLGSLQMKHIDPRKWSYCAMGMAVMAAGRHTDDGTRDKWAGRELWPWINRYFEVPLEVRERVHWHDFATMPAWWIISWYFHLVCENKYSLEHMVEWVRQNEPKSVQSTEETEHERELAHQ